MSDKVYRIKPLVWERVGTAHFTAQSEFGQFRALQDKYDKRLRWCVWCFTQILGSFDTLEAAQLAAEQWHRERMAVGLVEIQT